MGINPVLVFDIMSGYALFTVFGFMMFTTAFKGILTPMIQSKLLKKNIAFIDYGGIETPIITYDRGTTELQFKHKENIYSWNIPEGIERMLANNSRYILASTRLGVCFTARTAADVNEAERLYNSGDAENIHSSGVILERIRKTLSPKAQANTIDDRAKQISDRALSNINKPMIYAAGIGLVFIVVLFGYLIFTKAMEYDLAAQTIQNLGHLSPTTTLPQLPPLD